MMNPAQTMTACPYCRSTQTEQINSASHKGMLTGGMLGAAFVVIKLVSKPFPVLASALVTGCLLGLLWGAQAGRTIGGAIDEAMPRYRCRDCGEEFEE